MGKLYLDFVYIRQPGLASLAPYKTTVTEKHTTTWKEIRAIHGDVLRPIRRSWPAYAWPGGYPIYYVTEDAGLLCSDCANKNLKLTLGDDPQWKIVAADINYEDFLTCGNCSTIIESAYGAEEEDDENQEVDPA